MDQRTNQSEAKPPSRLDAIDGLRGLAILMVLAQHTLDHSIRVPDGYAHLSPLLRLVCCGQYGVQLFFVVSAFTLARSTRFRLRNEADARRTFFLRRAFRVIPLWWIATLSYAAITQPWSSALFATLFFYFGIFRPWHALDVFDVQWSMFVEESFYLALPWLLPRLTRARSVLVITGLTYVGAVAWMAMGKRWGIPWDLVYQYPPFHWYCFCLGLWVASLTPEGLARLSRGWGWILSLGSAVLLLGMTFLLPGLAKHTLASLWATSLLLAILVSGSPVKRLAESRLLTKFGICSYSIYLFHLLVGYFAFPWQDRFFGLFGGALSRDLKFVLLFPLLAVLNFALAQVSYRFLERPSIELGRQVIRRWQSRSALIARSIALPIEAGE